MVVGTRCSREATGSGGEGQGTDRQLASWERCALAAQARGPASQSAALFVPTPGGLPSHLMRRLFFPRVSLAV